MDYELDQVINCPHCGQPLDDCQAIDWVHPSKQFYKHQCGWARCAKFCEVSHIKNGEQVTGIRIKPL